jgi:hypothetical protein
MDVFGKEWMQENGIDLAAPLRILHLHNFSAGGQKINMIRTINMVVGIFMMTIFASFPAQGARPVQKKENTGKSRFNSVKKAV